MTGNEGFEVVRMKPAHIDALVAIERTSDENFWNKRTFQKHLAAKNHGGLVAIDGLNAVGGVAFERKAGDGYLQIWNIVVSPEYRRKGVGRLLVSRLLEMVPCEYDGVSFFVRQSNKVAHLFLNKLGFWCDTIARDYFIDKTVEATCKEDAYGFDYNPSKQRSKDDPLRITNRVGIVVASPRPSSREGSAIHFPDRLRNRKSQAG